MRQNWTKGIVALAAVAALAACALAACSGTAASGGTNASSASSASSASAGSASSGAASSTAASSTAASSTANGPSSGAGSFSPVSIVRFEGVENAGKLVADMEAGAIPVSSTVCYDQMGTLPAVTVTDPATIADIYGKLAGITVVGPSDESITDCYHFIGFELQDGTAVRFSFEGEGLLSLDRANYSVSGGGALWSLVRGIQGEYMDAEGISAG